MINAEGRQFRAGRLASERGSEPPVVSTSRLDIHPCKATNQDLKEDVHACEFLDRSVLEYRVHHVSNCKTVTT